MYLIADNKRFSTAAEYWDAKRLITSDLRIFQKMMKLTSKPTYFTDSYLGPREEVTALEVPLLGTAEKEILVHLSGPYAHVKVMQVDDAHCLHKATTCSLHGFSLAMWVGIGAKTSRSFRPTYILKSKSLSILTSYKGLQVSVKTDEFLWEIQAPLPPVGRFANLAATWSMDSGLGFFLNGIKLNETKSPLKLENETSSKEKSSSVVIGNDYNSNEVSVEMDVYNMGFWYSALSDAVIGELMQVSKADDYWVFSGELALLQPIIPSLMGSGARLVPNRNGDGFGASTELSSGSYIVLASQSHLIKFGSGAGRGVKGLINPDTCLGILMTFYVKLFPSQNGTILGAGAGLPLYKGVRVFQNDSTLHFIVASSNWTFTTSIPISYSNFGKWKKIRFVWSSESPFLIIQFENEYFIPKVCFSGRGLIFIQGCLT